MRQFKQLFETLLTKVFNLFPKRTKRMMFVVMVSAQLAKVMNQKDKLDKAMLTKLNHVMLICSDVNAMETPNLLSQSFWKDKEVIEECGKKVFSKCDIEQDLPSMIKRIKQSTPLWLCYGGMDSDIAMLLKNAKKVLV